VCAGVGGYPPGGPLGATPGGTPPADPDPGQGSALGVLEAGGVPPNPRTRPRGPGASQT